MLSVDVQKYLRSVSVSEDYSTNFNTLCTVSKKLSDLKVKDSCLGIILDYDNINRIVESVVSNNIDLIKSHKASYLFDNSMFIKFIDAYCINNNYYFDGKIYSYDYYRFSEGILVLSPTDERYLFELLAKSVGVDRKNVRDKIIVSNLRLVRSMAYKYSKNSKLPYEDLVEEGIDGLIKAVDTFDVSTGNKFSTYAYNWINARMNSASKEKTKDFKFSSAFLEKMRIYLNIKNNYIKIYGENPSLEYMRNQMRDRLRYKISDNDIDNLIRDIEKYSIEVLSLSSLVSPNEGYYLEDTIPDYDSTSFIDEFESRELHDIFKNVFDIVGLNDRERQIMYYRFELNGYPKLTYESLAKMSGISHQRVREIEKRVLKLIKNNQECMVMLSGYHK